MDVKKQLFTTGRPDQVCGVHFFNPAPMISLVEIVRPLEHRRRPSTPSPLCHRLRQGGRAGFIVNALLFPYLNNAVRMLENGTASRDDIDAAMKGGCNFPIGPLALLDLVGLDTSLSILDALYDEFRDRTTPPSRPCGAWSPPADSDACPATGSTTTRRGSGLVGSPVR